MHLQYKKCWLLALAWQHVISTTEWGVMEIMLVGSDKSQNSPVMLHVYQLLDIVIGNMRWTCENVKSKERSLSVSHFDVVSNFQH